MRSTSKPFVARCALEIPLKYQMPTRSGYESNSSQTDFTLCISLNRSSTLSQ